MDAKAEQEKEFRIAYNNMADMMKVAAILLDYMDKSNNGKCKGMNDIAVRHYKNKLREMMNEEEKRLSDLHEFTKTKTA